MEFELDINQVINLANKRNLTLDEACKYIFGFIQSFQDKREEIYLQEFKERCQLKLIKYSDEMADELAREIKSKIEKDVIDFAPKFATSSIDKILDAMNENRFRTKKGPAYLIVLLTTLKETYSVK
jgi:hypothetical protein